MVLSVCECVAYHFFTTQFPGVTILLNACVVVGEFLLPLHLGECFRFTGCRTDCRGLLCPQVSIVNRLHHVVDVVIIALCVGVLIRRGVGLLSLACALAPTIVPAVALGLGVILWLLEVFLSVLLRGLLLVVSLLLVLPVPLSP